MYLISAFFKHHFRKKKWAALGGTAHLGKISNHIAIFSLSVFIDKTLEKAWAAPAIKDRPSG
jgi:hypothetical protein